LALLLFAALFFAPRLALFFAALPRADIDFDADFRAAAFRPAFFVPAALRPEVFRPAAFRLVARPLPDLAAFRPLLLVPLAALLALRAAAVPRRATALAVRVTRSVASRACVPAIRAALAVCVTPREAADRTERAAVRARVTTACAPSPVAVAALCAPPLIVDTAPETAVVSVFVSASNPPAAVPSAPPTVSAVFINVLSLLLSLSSGEFGMFTPYRVPRGGEHLSAKSVRAWRI
jgi:hypothetical protein